MAKISIIAPVYNVEKYLAECLESLINQTFKDIEILLIDDASQDNSLKILEEYQRKDKRIRIFTQQNQGPGAARNLGIKESKGEYLLFVDSDDWIKKNCCEILYNEMQKNPCDILFCSRKIYHTKDNIKLISIADYFMGEKEATLSNNPQICSELPGHPWGKLYKADFIKKNNIFFPSFTRCAEDVYFHYLTLFCAPCVRYIDEPLYYYRFQAQDSLVKQGGKTLKEAYAAYYEILLKIKKSNIQNKTEILTLTYNRMADSVLYFCSQPYLQYEKYKYLYILKDTKNLSKMLPKKERSKSKNYKRLVKTIKQTQKELTGMFFNRFLEIEKRSTRVAIYLFERQILNFSRKRIDNLGLKFSNFLKLQKIKFSKNYRKIKVAFVVNSIQTWDLDSLFEEFKKSKYFEPVFFVDRSRSEMNNLDNKEKLKTNMEFFSKLTDKTFAIFDYKTNEYLAPKEFKKYSPDIVFYQNAAIPKEYYLDNFSKKAFFCYIPENYNTVKNHLNYTSFHAKLWRYFVESDFHKNEYKKLYRAKNCITVGSAKFDNYKLNKNIKKDSSKKTVIYAPHYSFSNTDYKCATIIENGNFILELANNHPEINWVFRPHPKLYKSLLELDLWEKDEIDAYWDSWAKIGKISTESNYQKLFLKSDMLITDCLSFLTTYLPTQKPVLHLRAKDDKNSYFEPVKEIISSYYQINSIKELSETFNRVLFKGDDYLEQKRKEAPEKLNIDPNKTTGRKIYEYLINEFSIKENNGF